LLVGCTRDPEWGWVLAVGLGGVWVEILKDVSLRLLPASESVIREMLSELRGAKLLSGQRGIPAADIESLARAARRIGEAALGCGDDLVALEVNPLWVRGGQVEALDALFVWREDDAGGADAHPAT
jgi:acetate---CoA ligase (ADP-forming)